MSSQVNADGLLIHYGTSEATVTKTGVVRPYGNTHLAEVDLDFSDLAATGTETILGNTTTIPSGAHIESAEIYVETAFVGATATLTVGLIDQDRTTAIDADGIDAAVAVAALTAGATIACDGALVGTTLSNAGLITATEGTAAFTAGAAKIRIYYYIP